MRGFPSPLRDLSFTRLRNHKVAGFFLRRVLFYAGIDELLMLTAKKHRFVDLIGLNP
jgi:hypothetical protein